MSNLNADHSNLKEAENYHWKNAQFFINFLSFSLFFAVFVTFCSVSRRIPDPPHDVYSAIMSTRYLEPLADDPQIDGKVYKAIVMAQLAEDFRSLQRWHPPKWKRTAQIENQLACRYDDLPIFDRNRVRFPPGKDDDVTDFYPAALVDCPRDPDDHKSKRFIAAESPHDDNVDEFWKMVWAYGVTDIVWLGNYDEFSRNEGGVMVSRCAAYFPTPEPEDRDYKSGKDETPPPTDEYGEFQVTGVSRHTNEDVVWREFKITNQATKETRKLRHRQHKHWYPFGCPRDVWNCTQGLICKTWQDNPFVKNPAAKNDEVTLVHCSNGVGRTGTAIAIDFVTARLKLTPTASITSIIRDELRRLRPYAVQTPIQLLFVHIAVYKRAYAQMVGSVGFADVDHSKALYAVFDDVLEQEEPRVRVEWE